MSMPYISVSNVERFGERRVAFDVSFELPLGSYLRIRNCLLRGPDYLGNYHVHFPTNWAAGRPPREMATVSADTRREIVGHVLQAISSPDGSDS